MTEESCYLLSNYTGISVQQTDTKSSALFVRAQKASQNLSSIMKISFDNPNRSNRRVHRQDILNHGERVNNSLMIEISLYKHINSILNNNYTPHLVRMLDYIHCDNFINVLRGFNFNGWPQLLTKILNLMTTNKLLDYNSSNILCLEYIQDDNFKQWLDSQQWTLND